MSRSLVALLGGVLSLALRAAPALAADPADALVQRCNELATSASSKQTRLDAYAACAQARGARPQEPQILLTLGRLAIRLGQPQKALQHCQTYLKVAQDDRALAIQCIKDARKLEPPSPPPPVAKKEAMEARKKEVAVEQKARFKQLLATHRGEIEQFSKAQEEARAQLKVVESRMDQLRHRELAIIEKRDGEQLTAIREWGEQAQARVAEATDLAQLDRLGRTLEAEGKQLVATQQGERMTLARELQEDRGRIDRPPLQPPGPVLVLAPHPGSGGAPPERPLHRRWWFWTTVGAVAAAGVSVGLACGLGRCGNGGPPSDVEPPFQVIIPALTFR